MRGKRAAWAVVLAVVVAVAAVPALREQARVQRFVLRHRNWLLDSENDVLFVRQHYPHDAEMLLAAALNDPVLLRQAIAKGAGPAAWAAYAATFPGIPCNRVASGGVDPEDTRQIREMEMHIASSRSKEPTEQDAKPLLEALRGWEAADPQNGLPVALEAIVLYSLRRDRDAFLRWQEAGRLPTATAYTETVQRALKRLYERMGVPELESLTFESVEPSYEMGLHAQLRNGARIAIYEGRLAQMQGRPRDAAAWWNATAALGDHLLTNGTDMGFLVGTAIQAIGAQPVWEWKSDGDTGTQGGPLHYTDPVTGMTTGYRLWYGPQHAFYESVAGKAASDELRDKRLKTRIRLGLMSKALRSPDETTKWVVPAWTLPSLATGAAMLCAELLILLGLASVFCRREPDGTPAVTGLGMALIASPLLLALVWAVCAWSTQGWEGLQSREISWRISGIVALAAVLVAGILSWSMRGESAGLLAVWRKSLCDALPVMIALCSLVYLAIAACIVPARRQAEQRLREDAIPLVKRLGPEWEHPRVPADAWRAAYPPEPKEIRRGRGHWEGKQPRPRTPRLR